MIRQLLNNLSDSILATYPQYNAGYFDVFKPADKDVVINSQGDYCGIADNNGNYFYIRQIREARYTPQAYSCRPIMYQASVTCRIVSVMRTSDYEGHLNALIYAVSKQGYNITRAVYENTLVFREETNTTKMTNALEGLSLILVDFNVSFNQTAHKCPPQICDC